MIVILNPPPSLTPLQLGVQQIEARMQQTFNQLQSLFYDAARFIWKNPNPSADPQTVLNAFGANAADLFKWAAAYSALLQAATGTAPPSQVPPGWTVSINAETGGVTVTPPPPIPAPVPAPTSGS